MLAGLLASIKNLLKGSASLACSLAAIKNLGMEFQAQGTNRPREGSIKNPKTLKEDSPGGGWEYKQCKRAKRWQWNCTHVSGSTAATCKGTAGSAKQAVHRRTRQAPVRAIKKLNKPRLAVKAGWHTQHPVNVAGGNRRHGQNIIA